MHGTLPRNLYQLPTLIFREIPNYRNFYVNGIDQLGLAIARCTIFSMHPHICEADLNTLEWPKLSPRIHSKGYVDARTERRQQQFIGIMQFMVKDSKKFASTGGWGFAQFTNGNPDGEAVHKTCFVCHAPAKDSDFVFTRYSP